MDAWQIITYGGALGVLFIVAMIVMKGKLRLERELVVEQERRKEVEQQRDAWQQMAMRGTKLSERTVEVAETTTQRDDRFDALEARLDVLTRTLPDIIPRKPRPTN